MKLLGLAAASLLAASLFSAPATAQGGVGVYVGPGGVGVDVGPRGPSYGPRYYDDRPRGYYREREYRRPQRCRTYFVFRNGYRERVTECN